MAGLIETSAPFDKVEVDFSKVSYITLLIESPHYPPESQYVLLC